MLRQRKVNFVGVGSGLIDTLNRRDLYLDLDRVLG